MDISHFAQTAGGLFASIFVVATYTMTTMIPLRVFGILTNIILIAFAIPMRHYPTLILHGVLLPLNIYRLHQMLQLVRNVKKSVTSDLSMDWLKPFMPHAAGTPCSAASCCSSSAMRASRVSSATLTSAASNFCGRCCLQLVSHAISLNRITCSGRAR